MPRSHLNFWTSGVLFPESIGINTYLDQSSICLEHECKVLCLFSRHCSVDQRVPDGQKVITTLLSRFYLSFWYPVPFKTPKNVWWLGMKMFDIYFFLFFKFENIPSSTFGYRPVFVNNTRKLQHEWKIETMSAYRN